MEAQVKAIADTGANVVVTGGKVADMALHYANKYNIMLVRLNSKWDLRRLCKTVGATALPRLTPLSLKKWDIVTVFTSQRLEIRRWLFLSTKRKMVPFPP